LNRFIFSSRITDAFNAVIRKISTGDASDTHLFGLLTLPCLALLQLRQPRAVLLQEVVHIAFLRNLFMQAATRLSETEIAKANCKIASGLPVTHFSDVLPVLPALAQTGRFHVVQLRLGASAGASVSKQGMDVTAGNHTHTCS
jgi:hypothetical protein